MIENKKILILCKDETNKVQYYLIKELLKNNSIGVYFFEPLECVFNKCAYNEDTYYKFKEIKDIKLYDAIDIGNEFTKRKDEKKVNLDYLQYLEKNFTKHKNLNLQLLTSQPFSSSYHDRFFMKQPDYYQINILIELYYKKSLSVIEDFKPDIILDIADEGYGKTVMFECCEKFNIPYITLEHSRYEGFLYPTFNFGLKIDNYIEEKYLDYLKNENQLKSEINDILSYRKKAKIMPEHFKGNVTSSYNAPKLSEIFKGVINSILYNYDIYIKNKNYKFYKSNDVLYFSPWKQISFFKNFWINKRKLLKNNEYFVEPDKNDQYVYMPLHLIPESTTSVKAPWYIDELNIIAQISKALPAGTWLYVKEHQSMVGERALDFYKKASEFHNVKVVKLNYYLDPKPWLENSIGVITIAGTAAYEAALMGKKSLIFSDVPFGIIDGIEKVNSIEELSKLIRNFGEVDNITSCAAYIKTVKESGKEINLNYLVREARKNPLTSEDGGVKFNQYIKNILELYDNAIDMIEKRENGKKL